MSRDKLGKITNIFKRIRFNKFTIEFIFIYFLVSLGSTYAYYAYQVDDTVAITGNVVAIDADLEVDLVVGTNEEMVPMDDDALSNALKGVGSTNGACVDMVGNLSCQVYRIKLINKGSRLKHLNGTIELYPKEGSGNAYTNLKWRELSNTNTIKSDSVINGMNESFLVEDLTIESKVSMTWYIAVWISEADYDQKNTDKGLFGGTVKFDAGPGSSSGGSSSVTTPFIRDVMAVNAVSDADIDFSKTSAESNTNGIYYIDSKSRSTPIYYYRGAVDNNLLFAGFCWKIVRTTETGGLKLIYNGTPSSGTCNNTGSNSQIGTKTFNSSYNSPAYVGYMYGTPYTYSRKSMSSDTTAYVYGNTVTYTGGTYTLSGTTSSSSWSSIYSSGLNSNHYTCFTKGTTCTSVYYIYYTTSSYAYYITLTGGKTVEDALEDMLDNNTTSSTIKGNSTTEGTLDYWYYNNIEQAGYSSYIEDTVWCNDRSISALNGWDPDGGSTTSHLYFSGYNRTSSTYEPSLTCSRDIDKFTVSESNGNGDLDYPVGLLTSDEIMLAGGKYVTGNSTYYLYTGSTYWAGSPYHFNHNDAYEFLVYSSSTLGYYSVDITYGVRPSISLAAGFTISGGDGTTSSPYVVG